MIAVIRVVHSYFFFLVLGCSSFGLLARAAQPSLQDYRRFSMIHEGDIAAGQALFLNTARLACSTCHTIDGSAAKAGPDLFAAGDSFTRNDLIESVLQPSKNIANGYSTTLIETRDGESHTGIIKNANDQF